MLQAEQDLLVMAAQRGNHYAFRLLFQHYQRPLLRFAYKLCHDQEIANEATQESWITSAKSLRKLNDPRAFKSWIYRLTRWRTLDLLRQQQRTEQLIDNEQTLDSIDEQQATTAADSESFNNLSQAIERLPAVEKQMIHLFYLDDMSVMEISTVLDIAQGTVKSRLNRARQLLKQKYRSEDDEY